MNKARIYKLERAAHRQKPVIITVHLLRPGDQRPKPGPDVILVGWPDEGRDNQNLLPEDKTHEN